MKLDRHKKAMTLMLTATLTLGTMSISPSQAATTLKLSEKSVTITVGKSTTITANKKIKKWKSSNKTIATVKKVTNKKAKITGRKKGSCKITATNGKKTVKVNVTVRGKSTATATPTITNTPVATTTVVPNTPEVTATIPVVTNTPIVTEAPATSTNPALTNTPIITETPVITEKPEVTATFSATEIPSSSTTPTMTREPVTTDIPVVTTKPAVTTNPAITTTPSAIETVSPSSIIDINKVQASFVYGNEKILSIQNDNPVDFQFYTNGYYLEQKTDDAWMPLPAIAIYREPVPAVLKANSSISYSVEYLEDYGNLKDGTYRIVVPLFYTAPNATEATTYYVTSEFTIGDFAKESVSMTVTEQSNNGLSITITNSNNSPIQLNQAAYDIEVFKNDEWISLPSVAMLRPTLPMTVTEHATSTFSIEYTEYYGFLPAGTYRIVLPISQSGNTNTDTVLYGTFSIS